MEDKPKRIYHYSAATKKKMRDAKLQRSNKRKHEKALIRKAKERAKREKRAPEILEKKRKWGLKWGKAMHKRMLKKRQQRIKDEAKKGNFYGEYAIHKIHNGKVGKMPVKTFKWSVDAYEYFDKIVSENHRNSFFPKLIERTFKPLRKKNSRGSETRYHKCQSEIVLIKRVPEGTPDEDRVYRCKNEDGMWVENILMSEGFLDAKILKKKVWYIEEELSMYPKVGERIKITLKEVLENHLFADLTSSTSRRVILHHSLVFFAYDDQEVAFIRCKNETEAKRTYDKMLEETVKAKKTLYVLFTGTLEGYNSSWLKEKGAEKVGLTVSQFQRQFWK